MQNKLLVTAGLFSVAVSLFAQEALKSTEEEYYDFLSLSGITRRPTLGYRTLSDSQWQFVEKENPLFDENGNPLLDEKGNPVTEKTLPEHVWQNNNLGRKRTLWQSENKGENWFTRGFDHSIKFKAYGPEWYNSFNTSSPYGQNDGALWQGKGYNTSLTGGARLEAYGFELTIKPQVSFSQNLEFDLVDNSAYYTNKYAYIWGYGNNVGVDAPQRFGDSAFWNFDWGDTEIRWSWRTFTIGFGTQSPWIGPAWLNPVLHSNNAASYPKFDIGLRKTEIKLPYLGWSLGHIEARLWIGYLSESKYFDNDSSNDHNRINGFNVSYSPSFVPGLTIGVSKVCISKWNSFKLQYLNPFYSENGGVGTQVGEDQKLSAFVDLIIPQASFELYGEVGIDDYLQGGWLAGLRRYPFDSLIWTIGFKKSVTLSRLRSLKGEVIIEISDMGEPRNKISAKEVYAFNMHSQVSQGYTNKGQYLGTALANGGNAQTLLFNLYYPKGVGSILIQRSNPDNTYSYINLDNHNETYKGCFTIGISNTYYLLHSLRISTGFVYQRTTNYLYFKKTNDNRIVGTGSLHNFALSFAFAYIF